MRKIYLSFLLSVCFACFAGEGSLDFPIEVLISAEQINEKIKEYALQIEKDYQDKNLTVVMLMKGSICVASDLIRYLHIPFKLDFIKASSYGYNGMTGGALTISYLEDLEVSGRDVLVVDDIFETGRTMKGVCDQIALKQPRSIKTLVLLSKNIERKTEYRPDYVLFDIPDRFIIGYGLDYKEFYRGLPEICAFIGDKAPF